ncbi:MAG: Rpn family recombination-promoting nuclease/putative transposase, partial [Bacteroidota bacterium]
MANQPFNDLFVATFQIKSEVVAFLKNFVSLEISSNLDLDSLALDDNSYLTLQLDKFESDVVYNCNWKDKLPVKVSLLFEHKSSPPSRLALQLLRYMLEIWDKQIEQEQTLTIIIPIIVYHGEEGFRFKPLAEFFGEIADPVLKKFIPNFDALLVNLTNY